jgi:hypothetical protein
MFFVAPFHEQITITFPVEHPAVNDASMGSVYPNRALTTAAGNNKAPCRITTGGYSAGYRAVQSQTLSVISQTPQGQMPAQKPHPMHFDSSTTYS